ncbi:hypothetical protein Q9R08_05020 [Microbacterium sp. QXD-8]|uniref:Uncharacterized protein n=1 Tax=Microbacterium psychrotolerans TaxID=3068321 RepID=A0ABU0Z0I1_9MICO|nr:hypothetical protein [Microbacterium sp. QXD-8]MDQ7877334.1 hypothetical protein [Microbacterium sp. QXD-8]
MSVYGPLVAALRKRSRSVIGTVDGKPVYVLEAAADAITALLAEMAARDADDVKRSEEGRTDWDYEQRIERLTAPPTDDEREAQRGTAEDPRDSMARIIWETSRADEGTISATGANIVARALAATGFFRQGPITDAQVKAARSALGLANTDAAHAHVRAALEAARDAS